MRRDLIARRDLEQMETAAETARAQADLARAHLAQQEAMLAQVRSLQSLGRLSAPVSGMVSHRLVEPGAMMGENGTILILVGLETLKLTAKVPGGAAGDLLRGTAAQVSAPTLPGVISRGKVVRYGMRVDGAETFLEVEVLVDNRHRFFRPGMAVEARIDSGRQQEHLLVPRSAVRSENNNNYIYRIIDERASRQNAVLGPEHGEEIVIVQGLEEGDSVIADHLETLNPGGQIRPLDRKINHQ
jgi:RND family efflux transporter MFP subunit